jgi:transaldolase
MDPGARGLSPARWRYGGRMNDIGHAARVSEFVHRGIDLAGGRIVSASSPFWRGLRALGSELWLDTGDITAAGALWTGEFSALTTNNTLLNKEIQTGVYDASTINAS